MPKHTILTMRKWLALGKVAAALCVAGLIRPALAEDKKVVVSEAFQALHYLPLYVAIDKGFFTDQGLKVNKLMTGMPSNALSAVIR